MSRLLPRKVLTLAILQSGSNLLLGLKKRGFGKEKWCGFGGEVEDSETTMNAVLREVRDQCGLEPQDLVKVGILEYEFLEKPEILYIHVFKANYHVGEVTESEEMLPKWFAIENLPYSSMLMDYKQWLPLVLTGQYFHGYFLFDKEENVIEKRVKVMNNVPVK